MVQTMDGGISHTWGLCTSLLCRLLALGGPWGGSLFSHLWDGASNLRGCQEHRQRDSGKAHTMLSLAVVPTPPGPSLCTSAGAETGLRAETSTANSRLASSACAEGSASKIKRVFSKAAELAARRLGQRLQKGCVGQTFTQGQRVSEEQG